MYEKESKRRERDEKECWRRRQDGQVEGGQPGASSVVWDYRYCED
jgi:hypothetical protein